MKRFSCALAVVLVAGGAWAANAYRTYDGRVEVEGTGISAGTMVNWDNWSRSATPSIDLKDPFNAYLLAGRETLGRGGWKLETDADGALSCRNAFTLDRALEGVNYCGTRLYFEYERWAGARWMADNGKAGTLPENRKRAGLFNGTVRSFRLVPKDGGPGYAVTFPAPTRVNLSNDSAWCGKFSLRLIAKTGKVAAGERFDQAFALSGEGVRIARGDDMGARVVAGGEWVPMKMKKTVAKGGVTDFSSMGFVDAPAGKHGWLRRVGDHFEFEKRPGRKVKLCGANFVGTCCLPPTDAEADELIDRVIASGYNTLRLHHFDGHGCIIDDKDPAKLRYDAARLDRFDRFVAKCVERGLYLTIDLFSLRRPDWRAFGIGRPGDIHFIEMKACIHLTDWGFANWKAYAENLLNHVNPYTGRAYKDEPGIPLICLVNEGALSQSWKYVCESPLLLGILGEGVRDMRTRGNPAFEKLCMDVEERSFARMKAAVRATGAKALLTDVNNGPHFPLKNAFRERELDYFDNHAYVDHPRWLGERLKLPARQNNRNLLDYEESPVEGLERWRVPTMPYTVTEWNVNCPNPYRSAGGLYVGAIAARGGWDGLWRFTWAHGIDTLREESRRGGGFFDVMADPIMQANDRAFVALYMRGDAEGREAMRRDGGRLTFVVDTPRTQGGFGCAGDTVETSALKAKVSGSPATVTAIAVDGAATLAESSRILFTHLTDVQNSGRTWLDRGRTVISGLGKLPHLARVGRVDVALRLTDPEDYEVWACETDGTRAERVPSKAAGGRLGFTAAIAAGKPVRLVYEIVRKGARGK